MNPLNRVLSILGLTLAGVLASSAPAQADHGSIGISVYGDSRDHGYGVSWHGSDRGDYRYRDGYRHGGYHRPYSARHREPWCPTHSQYHNHSYGYYGFNGGYYGVYDGNSYEEVFSRAYDDGYSDGYNALGRNRLSDARAYRYGYERGYKDGLRDGRYANRRYRYH